MQIRSKVAHSIPYDHEAQIFLAVNQVLLTLARSIHRGLVQPLNRVLTRGCVHLRYCTLCTESMHGFGEER